MSTPSLADFDKSATTLFEDDFYVGRLDFSLKSRANNGVEFTVDGCASSSGGKEEMETSGSLGTHVECYDHGLSLADTWATDGSLTSNLKLKDFFANGAKLELESKFVPSTAEHSGEVRFSLARRRFFGSLEVDRRRQVFGTTTLRFGDMLIGCSGVLDLSPGVKVGGTCDGVIGVAYEGSDFTICARLKNSTIYTTSVHHRISPGVQWGVLCGFSSESRVTEMALAMRRQISESSFWKAKIDHKLRVGCSYSLRLTDSVQATFSTDFSWKSDVGISHPRFGLGLQFDA